jgi:hypothetical protein
VAELPVVHPLLLQRQVEHGESGVAGRVHACNQKDRYMQLTKHTYVVPAMNKVHGYVWQKW